MFPQPNEVCPTDTKHTVQFLLSAPRVAWFDLVWCGLVWFGLVRCGLLRCGLARCGWVWFGAVLHDVVSHGVVWYGVLWYVHTCIHTYIQINMCALFFASLLPATNGHRTQHKNANKNGFSCDTILKVCTPYLIIKKFLEKFRL